MGQHVIRTTPRPMPDVESIKSAIALAGTNFLVAGSRGDDRRKNKVADPVTHGNYEFVGDGVKTLAGKHLVVFTHGYNVTPPDALHSAGDFFAKLDVALGRDKVPLSSCVRVLFTWPGDVGTIYFNDAQQYAHYSGVALYRLLTDLGGMKPKSVSVVSHSLGAHVLLRALSILGERNYREKLDFRVDRTLLLAAAVEDDVFTNPEEDNEYHFPEAAFGTRNLHITMSRNDDVLSGAFRVNEYDDALGYRGPETLDPLASLTRRVKEILGPKEDFRFELHDFSVNSATLFNPNMAVTSHGGYWVHQDQMNYYLNLIHR